MYSLFHSEKANNSQFTAVTAERYKSLTNHAKSTVNKVLRSTLIAIFFVLIPLNLAFSSAGISAEDTSSEQNEVLTIPRAVGKIVVDGILDEASWQNALKLSIEYEMNPGENIPALVKTDAYITYDSEKVYFGFFCYDPDISKIRAKYAERDKVYGDDIIEIDLDTYNDQRRNYFFISNVRGSQEDGISSPVQGGSTSWDGIWESQGVIKENGYYLEVAIPFSTIQFQRSENEQTWGFNLVRWYPRQVYHALSLIPFDRNINSYQSQFMKMSGFKDIQRGKNLELVPTTTFGKTVVRDIYSDSDDGESSGNTEAGITARWGLTPNINISGAVNPDFSQVEADALQLDINSPMAINYPEKRPFFTEGADIFSTPLPTVYTRMMADPDWGMKISGKEGANTVGAYIVRDKSTSLILPGIFTSRLTNLNLETTSSVFRYKRDLGSRYTIGAIATDREGEGYFNRVAGVDGQLRLTDKDTVIFQVVGSTTKYPDQVSRDFGQSQEQFSDSAMFAEYSKQIKNSTLSFSFKDIGIDFRNDLGFNQRTDYRRYFVGYSNRWDAAANSWWSTISFNGGFFKSNIKSTGDLLQEYAMLTVDLKAKYQTNINARLMLMNSNHLGQYFDITSLQISSSFKPTAMAQFSFNANLGDRVDYANLRPAKGLTLNPGIILNFGGRLDISLDHRYEKLTVNGDELYTANISQASVLYHFSSRSLFRAILQYLDYDYNVSNYNFAIDPKRRTLFKQLLYSYKLNPRTVLYLGYSDNYLNRFEDELKQADSTIFVKVGYAFAL